MKLRIVLLSTLLALFVITMGCNVKLDPNRKSSMDKGRVGAMEIYLGRTASDSVDFVEGDQTDWKFFKVPQEGLVKVTFSFFNTEANGNVMVKNAQGQTVTKLLPMGQDIIKQEFHAKPGNYYLEIWCERVKTQYSVELEFIPF